ncbi:MAG: hypothetical protein EOP84_33140 [Verrucomicrobiaceae bacterium]|nr:MAG: hypothetical protein EOP84_33140 [Verrucomicrobiaceae bacterium]
MNKTLNTLAIAAAACLTLGGAAHAGSMGYPEGYAVQDFDDNRVITERRVVVRQQPTYVVRDRDEGFGERVVKFPFRTARTVVRSPMIIGETASGRREIISDDGFFARDNDRRLSSRRLYWDDNRRLSSRRLSSRDWNDNRLSRGVVRTSRTVTRTPVIVGETLTGDREIINDNGRPFYYTR